MFEDTETDMLPRQPPKPTEPLSEEFCKPTVPEVSLLFGQQNNENQNGKLPQQQQQQQAPAKKVQSYASWKKQMLPQVVYPPSERENFYNIEEMPLPSNNLYPFRPQYNNNNNNNIMNNNNKKQVPSTPFGTVANQYNTMGKNMFQHNVAASGAPLFTQPFGPRINTSPLQVVTGLINGNLNTATPAFLYQQQLQPQQQLQLLPQQQLQLQPQQLPQQQQLTKRRSMDDYRSPTVSSAASVAATEVLTICAGTQTDNIGGGDRLSPETLSKFATKADFDKLLAVVQEIKEDQKRIISVCEVILLDQQHFTQIERDTIEKCHVGTQYENQVAMGNGEIVFQSPRPAAQSTAYHANTPTGILRHRAVMQPKATDKTLTMNELAMKYLPNDKLHELMHDIHLDGSRQAMKERVMMAAKSPNDISNASYKYLKKYRLLSDEQNTATTTPKRIQERQQQCSPNETRPTDSPIMMNPRPSNEGSGMESHEIIDHDTLNLEELRNKPKFL